MILNVLLDLDGTLTDPALGITNCIAHALFGLGVAVPPLQELHFAIGPSLRESFATMLATSDTPLVERAMTLYRERFAVTGLFENTLYDGVPEMLAALKAQDHRLILATAKPHVYARRILGHFDILTPFDAIYGSELDGTRQHKGDLLAYLIAREKIDPNTTVMVGDRHHDIDAAHANGCLAIGVTYGYGSAEELAHANLLCASPLGIVDAVAKVRA
ncbi:MAG: HAD hydrolase-like protein [Betaproteobacteria bacterium]